MMKKNGLRMTVGLLTGLFLLIALPSPSLAATWAHCAGFGQNTCSAADCGPFMCGITTQCANLGDCQVNDIMIVVYNVGNFVLAIVAGLVFLMYVLGGFYFLIARGEPKLVERGKNYLKYSTFGLVIVFLDYTLIKTLQAVLIKGSVF